MVPVLSALACVYLMTNLSLETWLRFVVWMAIGFVIYFGHGKRNARLGQRPTGTQPTAPEPAPDGAPTGHP